MIFFLQLWFLEEESYTDSDDQLSHHLEASSGQNHNLLWFLLKSSKIASLLAVVYGMSKKTKTNVRMLIVIMSMY